MEKSAENLFDELATAEPIRDVSDFGSPTNEDKPLDFYEQNSANLTDLQYLIKTLSPDFKDDVYNAIMYARLSPDTFKYIFKLAVNSEIKRQDPYKKLEVTRVAMKMYTILTKALDGKHIIDILMAFGSQADNTELDAISKNIGLS